MSWRGRKGGLKAAKEGRPFVMCPSSHCYFNRSDGNPEDPFTSRYVEQIISLEKVYAFDPAKGLEGDAKKYLLGSQACFWSEVIWNRYDLDWRMWPRACALAEVLWTGGAKKDFGEFVSRLEKHRLRLIQQGVNVAPVYVKEKGDKL
jgi:hexosaminidase